MALETLTGVNEIGGFKIVRIKPDDMSWDDFDKLRDEYPINLTKRMNTISFKIQKGPRQEVGENGCDVDTIIEAAKFILLGFQSQIPCKENEKAIKKLDEAVALLEKRRKDRVKRGVEGKGDK